jgi:hypothetical protein
MALDDYKVLIQALKVNVLCRVRIDTRKTPSRMSLGNSEKQDYYYSILEKEDEHMKKKP